MSWRSIRFRLTLWYTLTLSLVLAASGIFCYLYLASNLLNQTDARLREIAREVADYHASNHREPVPTDACRQLESFIREQNWGEYIQLLNNRGTITCFSSNLNNFRLPLNKAALVRSNRGQAHFDTLDSLQPHPVRLLTYPVVQDGEVTDLIQVGRPLAYMEHALRDLRLILLTFSPLALLALSFGGWFLASRALSPVVAITRAARRINAENLNRRLPVPNPRDEIGHLAETFNATLARIEESFRKTKQFTGDASHELRTPLTILKGETEVGLRWAKSTEELHDVLASNMEEIERMERIIENLLTLAKSDAGELPLDFRDFSLSDLLQELYLQAKALGEAKHIAVSLELKVIEEIRLNGDELRLRQMFLNLIANAIKYTPEGGCLTMKLATEGSFAIVAISDTGIGISPEEQPLVFDRFYRVDRARNREDGGSGLGLAIVKWVVDIHQGRIDLESEPGKGSTFTVRLPLQGPVNGSE